MNSLQNRRILLCDPFGFSSDRELCESKNDCKIARKRLTRTRLKYRRYLPQRYKYRQKKGTAEGACSSLAVLIELEKMAENFTRFAKKKLNSKSKLNKQIEAENFVSHHVRFGLYDISYKPNLTFFFSFIQNISNFKTCLLR